ncbi:MAG: long-subunit fatty acid transport protein, partial [Myxococcota bacterium]
SVAWTEPDWVLAAELTWHQWSRYRPPTARIAIALEIPILPLAIPPNPIPQDADFSDIFIPRVGAEYRVFNGKHVGLWLRAGYSYEPTPAPKQPGGTNYVDTDKHTFAAGFSFRFSELTDILPKPFYLDVAGSYILMPERVYTKDDPADPVGDYVAAGRFLTLTSTMRWLF